ncbi:hypothetical protein [Flavobacterium haoranii]|uniref:Uncharacterized protein n=1 Tax=Flavobacterium haoranii TaxID=683124 RepID=A0A1M6M1H9_9FLAO|nr:hypothetical protein [Flavobacterium haoranii]SHJ77160.1 hypothetical protein SAMN05444337_2587 [Flavobacterium haoranii]
MKLKVFLAAVLLTSGLQSQAQLGDLVKNKLAKKKEKTEKADNSKSETKSKKSKSPLTVQVQEALENFNYDGTLTVKNADWTKNEEVKDAKKISGYYYMYSPVFNTVEKVFVRWNDYTYKSESKTFPGMNVVTSIWTKESADKSYMRYDLYPYESNLLSAHGLLYQITPGKILSPEQDMFVLNYPRNMRDDKGWIKNNYDLNTQEPFPDSRVSNSYDISNEVNGFLKEPKKTLLILVKDLKQLEGLTGKKLIETIEKKYIPKEYFSMAAAARAGNQAKPKGTTSGEFYTTKEWYNTAKSGMTNDLSAGKTIKYGYAPNAGWITTYHPLFGVPLYQSATYWFVVERSPEAMKKDVRGKYYLIGANLRRKYNGSGYDKPYYNGYSFADQDLTDAEFAEFKKMAVK